MPGATNGRVEDRPRERALKATRIGAGCARVSGLRSLIGILGGWATGVFVQSIRAAIGVAAAMAYGEVLNSRILGIGRASGAFGLADYAIDWDVTAY